MRITDVARRTRATPDRIRYLDKRRYIKGRWKTINTRRVRDYPEAEVQKIELIVKYLDQGYRYEAAFERASEELRQPRLI